MPLLPRRLSVVLMFLTLASASARLQAGTLVMRSGPAAVPLVELYTSEGCSSCPPAERWLGGLERSPDLWRGFVPVAFHVDYWDHLGWTDRYGSPLHGLRQRAYVGAGGLSQVYTPAFLVQGQEWRGWFRDRAVPTPAGEPPGSLALEIIDAARARVTYQPLQSRASALSATVAVLGVDLVSAIEAGENRGRRLDHDFVVLGTMQVPMQGEAGVYVAELVLPAPAAPAARYAYAAWVSAGAQPAPLQSVGGWADGP